MYVRVSHSDASCIRERGIRGPTLKGCVVGMYTSLTYQWRDASTLPDNMLTASRRTCILRRYDCAGTMGEWSRAESERLSTTAVASMTTASIPMHRTPPRATFRSRLSSRHGQWPCRRGDKSQATFEARRQRGHVRAHRKAIRHYEGRCLPLWRPQTPNWCHGLPDGKHH